MKLPYLHARSSRQKGAASIVIAMLLMFILVAAVTGVMKMTGSAVFDAATSSDQAAALFLAESGQERAQATLAAAARTGTSSNAICTALINQSANLGRGSFTYTNAVSTPNPCGGINPACTSCTVTVKGIVGATSRSIQAQLSANRSDGVEGQTNSADRTQNLTPNFTLNLKTTQNNSATFTHLVYNPVTNWGGDVAVSSCLNSSPGTSLTACTESWQMGGTYYNNPASHGIFAQVPTPGFYSITKSLTDPLTANPVDSRRNYVMVGVTFKGLAGGTVSHIGSYAQAPSGCPTVTNPRTQPVTANCSSYDYQHGYLPTNWTCNANNGTTANWSNAANADTMIIGFGGKPYRTGTCFTGTPYQMSNINLNGQPWVNQAKMIGTQCDSMYSQLWFSYNRGYDATLATATNVSSNFTGAIGASVTGTLGATVIGSMGSSLTRYRRNSSNQLIPGTGGPGSSGIVMVGDSVSGNGISANTTVTAVSTSGTPTLTLSASVTSDNTNRTYTITSNRLYVTAMTHGILSSGDTLSSGATGNVSFGGATIASNLGNVAIGGGSNVPSYYILSGAKQGPIASGSSFNIQSNKLNVTAVTSGSGALLIGDVISGTGVTSASISSYGTGSSNFPPTLGTYNLSGAAQGPVASTAITSTSTQLTVASVTSGTLHENDLIFGTGVSSGTTITGNASTPYLPYTGTTGSGLTGTYQISGAAQHVNPGTTMQIFSTTITLSGTTTQVPNAGTALGVVSGTGAFYPDSVIGNISGNTLTVTSIPATPTQVNGTNLSAGDALFGANVKVNTVISARVSGTGGTGTYTVTPSQTVTSGTIIARAAVIGVPAPALNSYTVSRLPDTPLTSARLCGGLCPFLLGDGTTGTGLHRDGQFDLTNIVNYDDWSAGLACLSGVDPASIETVGTILSKRGAWTEVVQ